MGALKKQARLQQWRGTWYLFYHDQRTGRDVRRSCDAMDAHTAEARAELLRSTRLSEKVDEVEKAKRGGAFDYQHKLVDALKAYRVRVRERADVRMANPTSREGLAAASALALEQTLDYFETWLQTEGLEEITTGQLDAATLRRFANHLASEPSRHGHKTVMRRSATINRHKGNLRAALNSLAEQRPPLFPDRDVFRLALKASRVDDRPPDVFTPKDLQRFLSTALWRETPGRTVKVLRLRKGKRETFEQTAASQAATPVSRLFLLLALTGMRLHEALILTWENVDLARGRVTVFSQKTGRTRFVPLTGAPEGELSPGLAALLRKWNKEAPEAKYVLPHGDLKAPVFPKFAWQDTNRKAKLRRLGPQMLRTNFTSYSASFGIPSAVATMWQGHSEGVAARYYRAQVPERLKGSSMEQAMGLSNIIAELLA